MDFYAITSDRVVYLFSTEGHAADEAAPEPPEAPEPEKKKPSK